MQVTKQPFAYLSAFAVEQAPCTRWGDAQTRFSHSCWNASVRTHHVAVVRAGRSAVGVRPGSLHSDCDTCYRKPSAFAGGIRAVPCAFLVDARRLFPVITLLTALLPTPCTLVCTLPLLPTTFSSSFSKIFTPRGISIRFPAVCVRCRLAMDAPRTRRHRFVKQTLRPSGTPFSSMP